MVRLLLRRGNDAVERLELLCLGAALPLTTTHGARLSRASRDGLRASMLLLRTSASSETTVIWYILAFSSVRRMWESVSSDSACSPLMRSMTPPAAPLRVIASMIRSTVLQRGRRSHHSSPVRRGGPPPWPRGAEPDGAGDVASSAKYTEGRGCVWTKNAAQGGVQLTCPGAG